MSPLDTPIKTMTFARMQSRHLVPAGFTLVETAIVLVIVALLTGGMMLTLGSQQEQSRLRETRRQLAEIKEALIGFAIANGRLPCPASPAATGLENPEGGGICTNRTSGFVPGITLGLSPTDDKGYVIDAWGNRIRYAVSESTFTTTGKMKEAGIASLNPSLVVCSSSAGSTASKCASGLDLTTKALAIVYSPATNGARPPTSADETANLTGDNVFVDHTATADGSPQGYFDDIVAWLSPNILFARMVEANVLP